MVSSKIAVVILNWNGKSFLEQFLPEVVKHSSVAEIIIADNASSDDSVAFLKAKYPSLKIIENKTNNGFAGGYNQALKQVNAEYYVLLNSDVEVTQHWIDPILALLENDKTIAACQPKILDYNKKNTFEYAGAAGGFIDAYGYPLCRGRLFNELEHDEKQYNDATEIFWATGACLFLRAEAFWKVGGFDADYFAHMEEIDLCWRLKNCGLKIYVEPKAMVYHVGGGTLNKLSPKKTYLNFRNNLITFTKNATPHFLFFKLIFRMLLDGVAAFKFLVEGNASHFTAVIKAHGSYYATITHTLKKRKAAQKLPHFKHTTTQIINKNIVFQHFLKGVKSYNELIQKK